MSVSTLASPLRHPDKLFIGGEWRAPATGAMLDVFDSGTEEILVSVAAASEADIDAAVAEARRAFDEGPWPRMTHGERADYLRAIGKAVRRRAIDIARSWTSEAGMMFADATVRAEGLGDVWDFYAGLADTFAFVERHEAQGGGTGLLVREPVGVVGAIIPWNGPPNLVTYKTAPALLAGCTVVLKASPEAPCSPYIFAEICEEVGLPAGVFNVVTADRAVSERLVRHPGVDKVTFTGSTIAGRRIASICGERIARCSLELGGKSAAVILDDYDLDAAADVLASRVGYITGQVCSSLTRVVIPRRRHDAIVDALASRFAKIRVGDPFDAALQMGPLSSEQQRARVEGYIAKGKTEATLAAGGGRPSHLNRGYFVEPTLFANVENRATIAQEEIFGPVLSVIPADSEEHAIAIANDTIYGLNNSVFTNDPDRAYAVARQLRSGTVGHNSFRSDFGIAFGGFKQSGIGREGGVEGLHQFLEAKTIIMDQPPTRL
jgi:acyl-CoA reductase-like NAD-dependent aldehyde dehydrogenase